MFPWLVAGALLVGEAAAAAWCWMAAGRVAAPRWRRAWRVAVVAAVAAVPVIPGPTLPVRVERTRFEGPDVLAPDPVRSSPAGWSWLIPGVVGVRTARIVQGGTLLEERHRVEVGVPWLLLAVTGAGALARYRAGRRGSG